MTSRATVPREAGLVLASLGTLASVLLALALFGPREERGASARTDGVARPATPGRAGPSDTGPARRALLELEERSGYRWEARGLEGHVSLRAEVSLGAVDASRWVLRVERVEALAWTLDGQEVPDGVGRLEGATAAAVLDAHGVLADVEVVEGTSAEAARLLHVALAALQAPAPGARRLQVPFGLVDATVSSTPAGVEVAFDGADYVELASGAGTGTVRSSARGQVSSEEGIPVRGTYRERLELLADDGPPRWHAELSVALTPRDGAPARLALTELRWIPGVEVRSEAERHALEARAAGLTFESLLADLVRSGEGGLVPQHERWLWRATGLLRLQPERADELARACTDGTLAGGARILALDVLANAGDEASQRALEHALAHPALAAEQDYPMLLQRALLVRRPDEALLAFYLERLDTLEGPSRRAAASALGALVGHARAQDPSRGSAEVEHLVRALAAADTSDDRRALLQALGNARASEAEPVVLASASAADADERLFAVRALGRLAGAEGRRALLAIATRDESPAVRAEAIRALGRLAPSPFELEALAASVQGGAATTRDLEALAALASEVGRTATDHAPVSSLVEALLAREDLRSAEARALGELRAALRPPRDPGSLDHPGALR